MAKTDGSDILKKANGKKKIGTLEEWVEKNMDKFKVQITESLPVHTGFGNMKSVIMNILRVDSNLTKCTPISFFCAVMQAVQLGLEPNTTLGQCYLIPYWNSKIGWHEAQFQLGYKGLLEMGYRTNEITEIYADKVYKGDYLDFNKGTERYINHKPMPEKWEYDKNGMPIITWYYGVYKTIKGGLGFSIKTKDEIIKHMERFSPAAKKDAFSPWVTSEDMMAQKTVLWDVMRYAPLSKEDRRILSADTTVKQILSKNMLDVPPVYEFNPDMTKGIDDVKFEGEGKTPPESKDQEKPGQEDSKEKGKTQGVRKGSTGQDQTGQPEENEPDEENIGEQELDTRPITEGQMSKLYAMGRDLGNITPEQTKEFKNRIKNKFKLAHLGEMARFQFEKVNKELEAAIALKNQGKTQQGKMV